MKFLLIVACAALAAAKRFDGDQVLSLYPKTATHVELINEFGSMNGLADFWKPDSAELVQVGMKVDVRFPATFLHVVKRKIEKAQMAYDVKIDNLQHLINNQFDRSQSNKATRAYDYGVYHTYDEINQWSKDMASAHPTLIRHEVLITSEEGREIPMLTMGSSASNPIFLIDCGIHAREWISPAVCQCFVDRMLSNYGADAEVKAMMDSLTFVIFPVLNADGYAYSWTDDRMWRKTRTNYGTRCTGVDANRNFDAVWSGPGSSSSPCSETYYGPSVESEQLTKGLSNFVRANKGKIEAYVTFHSYGQVYIYPYSYAVKDADNEEELDGLAAASAAAAKAVSGTTFTYGPGYASMYLAAGGSDDFSLDNGVPISYTIELRDEGRYGFILPDRQIEPSCTEMYPAIDVISKHIMNKF